MLEMIDASEIVRKCTVAVRFVSGHASVVDAFFEDLRNTRKWLGWKS